MRRLLIALALLFVATSGSAEPVTIDAVSTYTFATLLPGVPNCSGPILSACVEYNLLSGSGTITFSVYDDLNAAPLINGGTEDLLLGYAGVGAGGFVPLSDGEGFVRVTITGDAVFDYFSVALVQTATQFPTTYLLQAVTVGTFPVIIPKPKPPAEGTPEPASLALLLVGGVVLHRSRRHGG